MSITRITLSVCFGLFWLALTYQTAMAEDKPADTIESPLSALYECSKIPDPVKRLACFDGSVAKLRTAEQNKEVVAIDAKVARKIKREAFGFNLPALSKIGLPKIALPSLGEKDKTDMLVADVKSVRKSGHKYVITLKNGQIWRQVGGRLTYVPKGDLKATIKPKSVGSFVLSLSNGKSTVRGLRVRRIE